MTFVDPVALLITHLDPLTVGTAVPVVARVPDTRPAEFVQIWRIGGPAVVPVLEQPRIDVRAWAEAPARAMEILLAARDAIWALVGTADLGVTVYACSESAGPRNDSDPETGAPMAWLTVDPIIRADPVVTRH